MLDVLYLISDGPHKNGDDRQYNLLKNISRKILGNISFELKYVYPYYDRNPKIADINKYSQNIFDYIETEHPKVIIAMGEKAFLLLGLPNTKVSEIASIPQYSPIFGGVSLDTRPKTEIKKNPLEVTSRGFWATKDYTIQLVSHTDILIYPTYKYLSMMSYANGYKGQALFERQVTQVKNIILNWPFKRFDFKPFIKLFYKKEHINESISILSNLKSKSVISFDIETAGYDVPVEAQLNPNHVDAKVIMIGFTDNDKEAYVFNTYTLPELIPYIKEVLENRQKHLTWNGKFDIEFLLTLWGVSFANHQHIDGMTCLYLKDMNVGFMGKGASTLKATIATFLDASYAGYQQNDGIDIAIKNGDGKYLEDHIEEYMLYCGIDVLLTYKLVKLLWNGLNTKSRDLVLSYYKSLDRTINEIHKGGIKVDVPLMEKHIQDLEEFCKAIEESLQKYLINFELDKVNFRSSKDLAYILYDVFKLPVEYTELGSPRTDSDTLQKFGENNIFCKLLVDLKAFSKQLELFRAIQKHVRDGRCYPVYNIYRTTSGRLSSYDPPIQIIPSNKKVYSSLSIVDYRPLWKNNHTKNGMITEISPNFKEIFQADEGCTFMYADYSQLEIVVLANFIDLVSEDKTLQKSIIDGRDTHSYTASLLYSIINRQEYTYEFIKEHKEEEPYKTWRQNSKSVIFKLIYGGTYKSLAKDKGISEDEAKTIFDTFLGVIPGIRDYMRHQYTNSTIKKYAETYAGHQRELRILSYERRNNKANNIALNHPIQGTASYIVNQGMIKYHTELGLLDPQYGRILLTVHDSIASQISDSLLEKGLMLKKYCMEKYPLEIMGDFIKVPLRIDLKYGKNWNI